MVRAARHGEVHLAAGLPSFNIVGLPGNRSQGVERIECARRYKMRYWIFPPSASRSIWRWRICEGVGRFDLPIALGILIASGQLKVKNLAQYEFAGELSPRANRASDHGCFWR